MRHVGPLVVVGGGVSAAHAALTLLERGYEVDLWDVGREEVTFPEPAATFHELKRRIARPDTYLLGAELEALIPPAVPELLRYPPARRFLAKPKDPLLNFESDGFAPFASFSKGGLANGWGANALLYDEDDMAEWLVSAADMPPVYRTVCERIPVAAPDADDLSPHLQGLHPTQAPVALTDADRRMYDRYARKRRVLNKEGMVMGLSRLAVVTDPGRPDACDRCDRCLWGCPRDAIYNPHVSTLASCDAYPGYRYVPGRMVLSLVAREGHIKGIRYLDTATGAIREEPCGAVFLAAGALQTGAIFLRTLVRAHPDMSPETDGLMDTAVVKIPFLALEGMGRPADPRAFQFNRLMVGLTGNAPPWPRYLHGELLHLTSLLYHPLIERMPFDSRLSKRLFFTLKSALGVVTLFFPDRIVPGNRQVLADPGSGSDRVRLCYRESADKEAFMRESIGRMRSALWRLGCVPQGAVHSPSGGGIHYAGTVPMGAGPKRCDANGRSNAFSNLYIADGAAFPTLPSKSITLSLAAHATRVARSARI